MTQDERMLSCHATDVARSVDPPGVPEGLSGHLTVTPERIRSGETVVVDWSITAPTSGFRFALNGVEVPARGRRTFTPTKTQTFMLTASRPSSTVHLSSRTVIVDGLSIQIFSARSELAQHPSASVDIPPSYKLLGGGAYIFPSVPGNVLWASYPASPTRWSVAGKDHIERSPSRITAYAIGLYDPMDEWETIIASNAGERALHPSARVEIPSSYVMTGGGAQVQYSGAGNLLYASYPYNDRTWAAASKGHIERDPAVIVAYAIGLRSRYGVRRLEQRTVGSSSPFASHPSAIAALGPEYHLTGGGARDLWNDAGNLLTSSYPVLDGVGEWVADGQELLRPDPGSVTAYAIGVRVVR
ncbi:hypothetical protein [Sorangium sp. So ce385]|uniref:hypothetical protein n=1 Tax=Sorangium sp. So ce385 TaxID=3133308 RepID=UPI003F5BDAF9